MRRYGRGGMDAQGWARPRGAPHRGDGGSSRKSEIVAASTLRGRWAESAWCSVQRLSMHVERHGLESNWPRTSHRNPGGMGALAGGAAPAGGVAAAAERARAAACGGVLAVAGRWCAAPPPSLPLKKGSARIRPKTMLCMNPSGQLLLRTGKNSLRTEPRKQRVYANGKARSASGARGFFWRSAKVRSEAAAAVTREC